MGRKLKSNILFAGSNVFYNAFITELTPAKNLNRVSGFGFAIGYLGGGLCLLMVMLLLDHPEWLREGADKNLAARVGFILTGVW